MLYHYDYLQWPKLSVRHWLPSQLNLVRRHVFEALENSSVSHKHNRPRIFRSHSSHNKHLFRLLSIIGFFEFHTTNNGHSVYVSQVMAYINGNKRKGGIWKYIKGGTCNLHELEVHHLNEDTTCNNCNNLYYVTPEENKFLHHFIKTCKRNFEKGIKVLNSLPSHIKSLSEKTLIATINFYQPLLSNLVCTPCHTPLNLTQN